jgi:quercetin dioxygenase-like cupin family protein
MAELRIAHLEDVEWQEVKAQLHGDRRVSVWEKYLDWTPELLVLYARYDPGMLTERHGHMSDHIVYVLEGEITVGVEHCGVGTSIVLEKGAVFGPIEAGPRGALLLEIMMGDPRAVPADPDGFAALLATRGVTPLPNPEIDTPSWFGERTDSDLG